MEQTIKNLLEELGATSYNEGRSWKGYKVLIPNFEKEVINGEPTVILMNDEECRLSTYEESFEYLQFEQKNQPMDSKDLAELIAAALDEKKATNIEIVDVRDKTPLSDYYVFATASNVRQLNALKEIVNETVESHGEHVHHIEGKELSGWILIDCYHVIVNVFTEAERNRIDLETLLKK